MHRVQLPVNTETTGFSVRRFKIFGSGDVKYFQLNWTSMKTLSEFDCTWLVGVIEAPLVFHLDVSLIPSLF